MRRLFTLAVLIGLVAPGFADAASPQLNIIQPRGVQRGSEAVLTFSGARLGDAEEVFFYEPGLAVTKLEAVDANQFKATVQVAPDCRLGEHTAQVRTKSGISEYRTFFVGPYPAHEEKEPNNDFENPQAIPLNVTVTGVVQSEDVDYFVVEAKKGQRISAEIEGMRLGTTLFDPYVAILDTKRFELSAADDTPLLLQDAVASIVAPEDGKYIIEVRESAYGGNGGCNYRLHVGTFPRPTAVYPAGGKIGEETDVRFIGDPAGEFTRKVKLPDQIVEHYGLEVSDDNGTAPSENPFRLFEHGNVLEQEPNDQLPQATPAELPLAFNGIIDKPGDVDCFKFAAKKGQVWEVECYGRRIRSPLDSVMNLYKADGSGIAGDDDARRPDSYIRFTVPEDGEYIVRITDHLGRGGPDFVYRIEFTPVKPSLALGIPRVARYSQYRQTIFVPRGNRFGTIISAQRTNFGGELVLEPKDLPPGIVMHAEPMPANLSEMPVVFEAAADAPVGGKLVDFIGRHADASTGISGGFRNTADFIIGPPGQSLYATKDVNRLAIAVVDELPFKLEIVEPKVPLVRDGSMQLKVVAQRKEGFTAPINVQLPFRPPGVGAPPSVTIPEGQNEVTYELNANGGAEIKTWQIFVLGSADVSGAAWVSSPLTKLEIAAPYVQFAVQRADVEQGKETDVVCQVTHNTPFEGAAKAQLLGLPHQVTAPELELTKDTKELVFKVTTTGESPPGQHKNIFCQVLVPQNGESVVHARVGGTELRIDKPLPPPTNPQPMPMPVAQQPQPTPPMEKRLSRLEKLRLEAMQKAASGGE
ncbi:MAG TPA: pre-peptidase C-terminal domain-containing protein [Planctomycetaceae bacterium]|nr:pre-peptidase C-terminal domain-containing protein [Planctomycetaceae bacterium]